MSDVIIPYEFLCKGGTAAALSAWNGIPRDRQLILETDTGLMKRGDGSTHYNSLLYVNLGLIDLSALADGYVPAWDAANSKFVMVAQSGGGGGGTFNPKTETYLCEDFWQGFTTSSATGTSFLNTPGVVVYTASTGTASITSAIGRPRQLSLSTSSNAIGRARLIVTGAPSIIPGGGVIRVGAHLKLPTLSTSGERYNFNFGLVDNIDGGPANRISVIYSDNVNSGNYAVQVWNGGVAASDVNTLVAPVAGTETLLEFEINAAGTGVEFFVDGVSAAVMATTIAGPMTLGVQINKSVGNTARTCVINYCEIRQTFTTPRG